MESGRKRFNAAESAEPLDQSKSALCISIPSAQTLFAPNFDPVTDAPKVDGKLDAVWRAGNKYKLSNRLCNMCCQSCKSNTYSVTFQRVETFSGQSWSAVEAMYMSSIGVASRSAKNERVENFVCVDGHCK
jgi:hypothetical protein